jgi:peroxiredoxin
LGAYGDPAAAPFEVMEYLANIGTAHTGYTHQAKHVNFDSRFIDICMVSADSPKQAKQWHEKGARTFRVAMDNDGMYQNESECLSETVGTQCIDCGLCDGSKRNADSIVITVHGSLQNRFKTARLIDTVEVAA